MNKSSIITLPSKSLRQKSKRVGSVTDEIKQLIKGMCAATLDWEATREHEVGVALAAVQVNRLVKVIVIRNDFDNRQDKSFAIFINPEITKYEGKLEQDFEGCLSIPDIYGKVARYNKIRIKAQDEQGRYFQRTAEGFLARVLQHEIDHTSGKLFIDHIKDDAEAFFKLVEDGHLEKIDYEKDILNNSILW
jgi:peptide deformylase